MAGVKRVLITGVTGLIGGVILPLIPGLIRKPPRWMARLIEQGRDPERALYWIVPNDRLVIISLLAVAPRLLEKIPKALGVLPGDETWAGKAFFRDSGEYKELYLAMLIVLFAMSAYRRMGPKAKASPAVSE